MKRQARFVAVAGVSTGLVFSTCGFGGVRGILQNETQKPQVAIFLATAANAVAMTDAGKEDAIVVTATRDGMVFLGIDRIDPSNLRQRVHDLHADRVGKGVYIRADARASFRAVEDVLDSLRAADVDDVGLLARRKNADGQQNNNEFLRI